MKNQNTRRGFTLIELLVVVLIIGILAAVALPQYQVAVEKARVAQILPMMRHIYDAVALYKLEHGRYDDGDEGAPSLGDLGVESPAGFWVSGNEMENDTWYCCSNEMNTGDVYCDNLAHHYTIKMWQPDDEDSVVAGKRACISTDSFGERVCKALGQQIEDDDYNGYYFF